MTVRDWLREKAERRRAASEAGAAYIRAMDGIPYHPQGGEVCAIADAIRDEHRSGALGYDSATYMEAARGVLNALSRAGFIVAPIPGFPADPDPEEEARSPSAIEQRGE